MCGEFTEVLYWSLAHGHLFSLSLTSYTNITKMESLNELKAYGESLGYQDEELRKFIQDQQAIFRDERDAARQKEKDDMVFQLEMEKEKLVM